MNYSIPEQISYCCMQQFLPSNSKCTGFLQKSFIFSFNRLSLHNKQPFISVYTHLFKKKFQVIQIKCNSWRTNKKKKNYSNHETKIN
jgi:hypothetical protein